VWSRHTGATRVALKKRSCDKQDVQNTAEEDTLKAKLGSRTYDNWSESKGKAGVPKTFEEQLRIRLSEGKEVRRIGRADGRQCMIGKRFGPEGGRKGGEGKGKDPS